MTGVMVSWAGTTTKLWAACPRDQAETKVWEFAQVFRAWFGEPGLTIEFGRDNKGAFEPTEKMDVAKYLPTQSE